MNSIWNLQSKDTFLGSNLLIQTEKEKSIYANASAPLGIRSSILQSNFGYDGFLPLWSKVTFSFNSGFLSSCTSMSQFSDVLRSNYF